MFCASGFDFLVDEYLNKSNLVPYNAWRRGESRFGKRVHERSGFTLVASEAGMDNAIQQVEDAINFLKINHDELPKLQNFHGVEACLDFGIENRDVEVQYDRFSPELLRLAGNLGIGIEVSRFSKG